MSPCLSGPKTFRTVPRVRRPRLRRLVTNDPFKGLRDFQRQRAEIEATIQQVGRGVAREKESQRAQEASRHSEVVGPAKLSLNSSTT